jgi:beta-phosphoglucomutase-like phosphatase (HAD superfamily)
VAETEPLLLLVDFGNTLVDETFLWKDSDAFPNWTRNWSAVMVEFKHACDIGTVSTDDLIVEMAKRVGCTPDSASNYFDSLCREIIVYPKINSALAHRHARGERHAMVTVNPDDLPRDIADRHGIAPYFELIVTSAEIRSDNKSEICLVACERLGVSPTQSVLIDNIAANVESWVESGGLGYVFEGDDPFAEDVLSGRVPGFLTLDVEPR